MDKALEERTEGIMLRALATFALTFGYVLYIARILLVVTTKGNKIEIFCSESEISIEDKFISENQINNLPGKSITRKKLIDLLTYWTISIDCGPIICFNIILLILFDVKYKILVTVSVLTSFISITYTLTSLDVKKFSEQFFLFSFLKCLSLAARIFALVLLYYRSGLFILIPLSLHWFLVFRVFRGKDKSISETATLASMSIFIWITFNENEYTEHLASQIILNVENINMLFWAHPAIANSDYCLTILLMSIALNVISSAFCFMYRAYLEMRECINEDQTVHQNIALTFPRSPVSKNLDYKPPSNSL